MVNNCESLYLQLRIQCLLTPYFTSALLFDFESHIAQFIFFFTDFAFLFLLYFSVSLELNKLIKFKTKI